MNLFKIILLVLVLSFCSKTEKKSSNELDAIIKQNVVAIFIENQKLHSTLIQNSEQLPAVAEVSNRIAAAKVNNKNEVLLSYLSQMEEALKKANPSDKEAYFKSISEFSEVLAKLNSEYKIDEKYNKFFCPMVSKYWVSEGKKVNNPYSADMRECGELVK